MKMLECGCGKKVKVEDNCKEVRCCACLNGGHLREESELIDVEEIVSQN